MLFANLAAEQERLVREHVATQTELLLGEIKRLDNEVSTKVKALCARTFSIKDALGHITDHIMQVRCACTRATSGAMRIILYLRLRLFRTARLDILMQFSRRALAR